MVSDQSVFAASWRGALGYLCNDLRKHLVGAGAGECALQGSALVTAVRAERIEFGAVVERRPPGAICSGDMYAAGFADEFASWSMTGRRAPARGQGRSR